jgi:hypothetical protein
LRLQDLSLHETNTIKPPLTVSTGTPPASTSEDAYQNMLTPRPNLRTVSASSSSSQQTPLAASHAARYLSSTRPQTPATDDLDDIEPTPTVAELSTRDISPPQESNRVDMVLNDVFSLLSLFFLTIGKVKESPGTYCQIASMRVSGA